MFSRSIALGIVAFLYATASLAEGVYMGVDATVTQMDMDENVNAVTINSDPVGGRVLVGYSFSPYFAVEASHHRRTVADGEISLASINFIPPVDLDIDYYSTTVSLVGTLPISNTVDVIGKLGYSDGKMQIDVESGFEGFAGTHDISVHGATLGGGIRFQLADGIAVHSELGWQESDLDSLLTVSIGVQFLFGS